MEKRDPPFRIVRLAGVRIHQPTEAECVAWIVDELAAGRGGWVVTPNLDILRKCSREQQLSNLIHEADLRVADGMPLLWAARLMGKPFPERVPGSSLISTLTAAAAPQSRALFLLGGDPGTAEQAAAVLSARHAGIRIAGTLCPESGFEKDPDQLRRISGALRASRADIVFVALGFPKQEHLIRSLRAALPDAWWLGVGISFSFLSNVVSRAPTHVQRAGLEWLHRLAQEPGRLYRRYLFEDIPFALRFFLESIRGRFSQGKKATDPGP